MGKRRSVWRTGVLDKEVCAICGGTLDRKKKKKRRRIASSGQVELADPLAHHVDEPPPEQQQRQQAAATPVATEEAAGFRRTKSPLNLAPTEKAKDESDAVSSGWCPPEHCEAVRPADGTGGMG